MGAFDLDKVTIFTDGACAGNPGPGGWACLLMFQTSPTKTRSKLFSGGEPDTTNNRMELMSVISALTKLTRPCQVDLWTDAKYVCQGFTEWLPKWRRRGWLSASRKPVKNVDLWMSLDVAAQRHKIEWHWIKGHLNDGSPEAGWHDLCDVAARGEASRAAP